MNNKKVEYELKQDIYKEHQIKDIKSKGKPQELMDFQDMDKKFYIHLENCEPLNIKTKNGYIEYIIDGITDDKCLFKHRQIGFMDKICAVPMEVAQKYSEEGMNIIRQLEELRAQNKSGFVDASKFINDILIIAPACITLAHGLGRVGCFLAGCCYGKETTSILGVTFPKGSTAYFLYGPNHNVLPTQLFEAIFLFILFIILFFMKKNQFITYLFSYGIFRFLRPTKYDINMIIR